MLHQTRFLLVALFLMQLAISPIQTLPSHQPSSSESTYSDVNDDVSSKAAQAYSPQRPQQGRLREKSAHQGDGTYYSPGLGSCGQQSGNQDLIVAVSHALYDSYGGGNDNTNAICGKSIRASYGAHSIVVTVVDRCEGCSPDDLDFSPAAFRQLSPLTSGRLHGIRWSFA
ncbi:hypothetical protein PCANC_14789 [Puccinia coronata f. sp. avenae]|uniref:Uncharacterized protein n=2 Tax=Puccinia coronata f. sp. avenae TaxID=200324 RepID=A0A2N5SNX1_9BASI|nr:hypothetical protein PCANC_14789 [Puccinia coronata f. sp. avenae]